MPFLPMSSVRRFRHAPCPRGWAYLCVLLGAIAMLPACSGNGTPGEEASSSADAPAVSPTSGFLGDYSDLAPGPNDDLLWVYRREAGVLARYGAFLFEPVLVFFDAESAGGGIDPQELGELADFLRQRAIEELEKGGFAIVDEPGPGVVRVRAAITGVKPIQPARNLGTKAVGMSVGLGLLVPSVDVGSASIEMEMLDAETGERLVAVVASREGRRFFNLKASSTRWGDTKAALGKWAEQLRRRLEEIRAER